MTEEPNKAKAFHFPSLVSMEITARTEDSDPFTVRVAGPAPLVARTACAFADALEEWCTR